MANLTLKSARNGRLTEIVFNVSSMRKKEENLYLVSFSHQHKESISPTFFAKSKVACAQRLAKNNHLISPTI